MRFWKAALAAVTLCSAGAIGLAAGHNDSQTWYADEYDVEAPVQHALEALSVGGSRIGASIRDVTADDVREHKLPAQSGALITEVDDDTPADEAGLREGDVVVEFDGERVRSAQQLTRLVRETPSGRSVNAVVLRSGARTTVSIAPSARGGTSVFSFMPRPPRAPRAPRTPMAPRPPAPPMAPMPPALEWFDGDARGFVFNMGGRLGIGIQSLSDQLASYFGVEEGVLVTSVEEDSAAAKAGLRAGDVITKIDGRDIDDTGDLLRALSDVEGSVSIEFVRDKKSQTVTATPETPRRRTVRRVI